MPDGFAVDLARLDEAAQGIARIMHDMRTCAVDRLDGGAGQHGHDGLHSAFEHFCDRWQYGVELLVEDGGTVVRALNDSIDTYVAADGTAEAALSTSGSGEDPAVDAADG